MKIYNSMIVPKGCPEWHSVGTIIRGPIGHAGLGQAIEITIQLPIIRTEAGGRFIPTDDVDRAVREEAAKANGKVVKALKEQIDELERLVKHFEIEAVNQGFLNGDA